MASHDSGVTVFLPGLYQYQILIITPLRYTPEITQNCTDFTHHTLPNDVHQPRDTQLRATRRA
jgi:hypothetical protein